MYVESQILTSTEEWSVKSTFLTFFSLYSLHASIRVQLLFLVPYCPSWDVLCIMTEYTHHKCKFSFFSTIYLLIWNAELHSRSGDKEWFFHLWFTTRWPQRQMLVQTEVRSKEMHPEFAHAWQGFMWAILLFFPWCFIASTGSEVEHQNLNQNSCKTLILQNTT